MCKERLLLQLELLPEPLLELLLLLLQGLEGLEEKQRRRRGAGESRQSEPWCVVEVVGLEGYMAERVRMILPRPDLCHLISENTPELWTRPAAFVGPLKRFRSIVYFLKAHNNIGHFRVSCKLTPENGI